MGSFLRIVGATRQHQNFLSLASRTGKPVCNGSLKTASPNPANSYASVSRGNRSISAKTCPPAEVLRIVLVPIFEGLLIFPHVGLGTIKVCRCVAHGHGDETRQAFTTYIIIFAIESVLIILSPRAVGASC